LLKNNFSNETFRRAAASRRIPLERIHPEWYLKEHLPARPQPKYGEGWGNTRAVTDEENTVVETSDYRSAAETRRNPLLQVKAGLSLWLAWNAEAMVSLPC
jgi:hypothetical protein